MHRGPSTQWLEHLQEDCMEQEWLGWTILGGAPNYEQNGDKKCSNAQGDSKPTSTYPSFLLPILHLLFYIHADYTSFHNAYLSFPLQYHSFYFFGPTSEAAPMITYEQRMCVEVTSVQESPASAFKPEMCPFMKRWWMLAAEIKWGGQVHSLPVVLLALRRYQACYM